MNPKEAEILGPAMGLTSKSQWVIKGVPHYATKSQIIHTLSQASVGGWPGWTIRPVKTLTTTRSGTVAWKIDAEAEPPMKTITLNNYLITIEAYNEKPSAAKGGGLPPLRIVPKSYQHEISPGEIYGREYGDDSDIADDEENADMEVEIPKNGMGGQTLEQGMPSSSPQHTGQQQAAQQDANSGQRESDSTLMAMFRQQTLLIESLQATIAGLQAELQRMREANGQTKAEVDDSNL